MNWGRQCAGPESSGQMCGVVLHTGNASHVSYMADAGDS